MPTKQPPLVVTINSSGRQAASLIRVASAVGWHVRAQMRDREGLVAAELATLPNVQLVVGELTRPGLVEGLFAGADLAFVNTTHWGDEVAVGRRLADAALAAGVRHYVYSSMPDHASFGLAWPALPMWRAKFEVEAHVRSLAMPSTFVYCGIYNNNFTTLPYPLFRMEVQRDGAFVWRAPFDPDAPLPWLDAEHDVGPALLQIFKEGPECWAGHRIPLTFEIATPREVCASFARALSRPVRYELERVAVSVAVPRGYAEHLDALQQTLGARELGFAQAPYFGPTMYYPEEAIQLWEGNRGMEEYAREAFVEEERINGQTWMEDDDDEADDGVDGDDEQASKAGSVATDHKPADAETL